MIVFRRWPYRGGSVGSVCEVAHRGSVHRRVAARHQMGTCSS